LALSKLYSSDRQSSKYLLEILMKNLILVLWLAVNTTLVAQDDPFKARMDESWNSLKATTFSDLVKANSLVFAMPENFEEIKVKRNYDVFYQYAIKDKLSNFEIRIFVRSFKDDFKDTTRFNPNKFSYNFLVTMALEASGNVLPDIPQIDQFPKEAVKNEFNADWGATTAFVPKSEFGKGFNFCSVNSLRRDGVCQVYIFYMFDNVPEQRALMQKGFYVLRFKDN
jgi:hypothetical protein